MPLRQPVDFDDLMRLQHVAAVNITGADHSCWTGRLGDTSNTEAEEGFVVLGVATGDNALLYHEELVLRPLRQMFDHQGEQQDAETLLRYRYALLVVLHENAHLLAREGTDVSNSQGLLRASAPTRALEEGVMEAYSHRNLDRYIDELQLEKVAPGIKNVVLAGKYPNFTPAAQALSLRLGRLTGLGSDEVLRRFTIVTPSQRWPDAARMVFLANDLHPLVPGREALVAKAEIEAAMKRQFTRLEGIGDGPLLSMRAKSVMVGNQAFDAGQVVADRVRRQYGGVPGAALSGGTERAPEAGR